MQYKKHKNELGKVKVLFGLRPCKEREGERRFCAEG